MKKTFGNIFWIAPLRLRNRKKCQVSVKFIASSVTLSNSLIPAQFARPAPFGNGGIKPAQPRPSLKPLSLLDSLKNTLTVCDASYIHENQGRCVNSLGG